MEKPKATAEHQWLMKMVGDWTVQGEAIMGPDKPAEKYETTESVRSLGSVWTMGESRMAMPNGDSAVSIMTLGYDPLRERFVGTFVTSMLTFLWSYSGTLDAARKVLTLDTEGPGLPPGKGLVRYQDVIEFLADDHRTLTSRSLGEDGKWTTFMVAHYRRRK